MKTDRKNRRLMNARCCCAAVSILLISSVICSAAEPFETVYDWTDIGMDGWGHGYTGGSLSNPGGYLQLGFGKQYGMPTSATDYMGVQVVDGQVLTNLQFRFNSVHVRPSAAWIAVHSAESGKMWRHPIELGAAGDYVLNNIDVSFENGWSAGPGSTSDEFLADMQTADWVGIFVRRGGSTDAQSYRLDDFRITGYTGDAPVAILDSDGDGMTDEWEAAHGLDPNAADDADLDSDGDGMSNYAEYLTGADPNDSSSVFGVEMSQSNKVEAVEGFILEWSSLPGRQYDVLRATNLSEGFEVFESDIQATPPRNSYHDQTATNGQSFFYKIRVRE